MNRFEKQFQRIKEGKGFIAALDQSGGSTPKALLGYGIQENDYNSDEEMFDLMHQMRVRVMKDSGFTGEKIIGVILFEKTMNSLVDGIPTSEFLWGKNIVPFLKIDKGLKKLKNGVKLMKDIPNLSDRLKDAKSKGIFGTKMRSVIYSKDAFGISEIARQQFDVGKEILDQGLIPIIEPEVDIHAEDKEEIEAVLREAILEELAKLEKDQQIILKLTLPSQFDFYRELIEHPKVLRVFALSGGYELEHACELLSQNHGMIASFSRALLDDLKVDQTDAEFSVALDTAIYLIFNASLT